MLKGKYVVTQADGSAVIPFKRPSPFFSWDNGFFAALAAEVGDTRTAAAMLDYADKHWNPTWFKGGLYYPRNDNFIAPGASAGTSANIASADRFVSPRVNTLTGNALLALARVNVKDGLYTMFSAPWTAVHFKQPFVAEVQHPNVHVSRAVYDAKKKALIATIKPSPGAAVTGQSSFSVNNLAQASSYTVWINGEVIGVIAAGVARSNNSRYGLSFQDGWLTVAAPLAGPLNLVVQDNG